MSKKFKEICLSRKRGKAEIIAFFCYIIGIFIISYYHEPWFDEAQAWMIARCATIKEIMFEIPHYEGHPPLWHLLLVPFAKLGAPYELSLFLINAVFCIISVALLLWRSPFPKMIRCLLPFSYFFFYQFGVISRPYSMMMLALVLAAILYPSRNRRPVRYFLVLVFLCLTSAYGMALACGMCLIWTGEIFKEYQTGKTWKAILHDKRVWLLLCILIFAVGLLLCMLPAEDVFYDQHRASALARLRNALRVLILPFDSWFGCYISLDTECVTIGGLITECIGSVILWVILLPILHTNHKKRFLIPYMIQGIAGLYTYFALHHEGVGILYMVFAAWVMCAEGITIPPVFRSMSEKIKSGMIRKMVVITGLLVCAMPYYYTVAATVNELQYPYGMQEVVDFIQENHLEDRKLMTDWSIEYEAGDDIAGIVFDETLPADFPEIREQLPDIEGMPVAVLPYFDGNIFMNFNADDPDCMYMRWRETEDVEAVYASWAAQGLPDLVFGSVPLQAVYSDEELNDVTYYWIDTVHYGGIWKNQRTDGKINIYIREDLLDEYPQFEVQKYATILTEPIK